MSRLKTIHSFWPAGDGSTLSLDFTTGVLDPRLTFTRSTSGTYIGADGLVKTMAAAPTNDPTKARFDYDPTTLEPRGLLIEGSATNLAFYSEYINPNAAPWNVYWFVAGAGASVTPVSQADPAGGTTASRCILGTSGSGRVYNGISTTAGVTYTLSFWARSVSGTTSLAFWHFNSATGNSTAVTIGTSWQRYQVTILGRTGGGFVECGIAKTTTNAATVDFWGLQLESGSGASSYIPTGASTGSRAADFCTIPTSSFITGPLYPQTLFAECIPANPSAAFLDIVRLFDRTAGGTFNYGTELYYYSSSTMTVQRKINASTNTDRSLASGLAYNSRHKLAVAVDSSAFLGSYDGLTGGGTTTAPSALASQVTHMGIGCSGDASAGSVMFGTIRQIKFFPFAMAQSQLNALTTL